MSGRRRVVQIVKQLEGRSKLEESILKKKHLSFCMLILKKIDYFIYF
jgi:hypothetical protein